MAKKKKEDRDVMGISLLKPCPLCGSEAQTYRLNKGRYWFAECLGDPGCCRIGAFASEEEAIRRWNTRYKADGDEKYQKVWETYDLIG